MAPFSVFLFFVLFQAEFAGFIWRSFLPSKACQKPIQKATEFNGQ
jgi:hypothetical protein